jgi:hypothetical protein
MKVNWRRASTGTSQWQSNQKNWKGDAPPAIKKERGGKLRMRELHVENSEFESMNLFAAIGSNNNN